MPAKASKKKTPAAPATKRDLYQEVTDKIIALLETGVRPWARPWEATGVNALSSVVRPRRVGGQPYRGVNVMLLWGAAMAKGYTNPTWMTYNQAAELGGQVRKGEKGEMVVYGGRFVKTIKDEGTGEEKTSAIPFLKSFTVFNVEQIDGLPEKFQPTPEPVEPAAIEAAKIARVEHAERFFANLGADLRHGGAQAFYSPLHDRIQMPAFEDFHTAEGYYSTLGHEHIHWTKHESRLNRDLGKQRWGDEGYAREELVAELGAAFLSADLGLTLEVREDHASYIDNWLQVLKNDRKFIVIAASYATKALEFLHAAQLEDAIADIGDDLGEDASDHDMALAA